MTTIGGRLDLTGLKAPLPISRVEEALRELPAGSALRVVVADSESLAELTAFARRKGYRILDQSEGGGEVVLSILANT